MAVDVKKVIAISLIPIIVVVVMSISEVDVEVAMDIAEVAVAPTSIVIVVIDMSIFADVLRYVFDSCDVVFCEQEGKY